MDGRKVTVKHGEAVLRQQRLDRLEIVVKKMLMIDLVEGEVLDDLLHVQELNDEDAIIPETLANSVRDRMQFFQMEKHSRGIDHIELAIQRTGDVVVEEGVKRFDPVFICD